MTFEPKFLATAIGSMPQDDPAAACELILKTIPEIPIWPQLPNIDFREEMEIQYSEGLPCVVLDPVKKRMFFETEKDITSDFEVFYENYMAENLDHFGISPAFGHGISAMIDILKDRHPKDIQYFKSHVTGPVTVGLGRVDENKRSVYYNDMFRDVIVKGTEMKARWLLRAFDFLGCPQICFIDEPILSGFGSSTYVSVHRQDVIQYLNDVIRAVHGAGALAGIHCCGNTDWSLLVDAGVDIISFDAYNYGETIAYYPERIRDFLERGGVLAWGIVPTSEKIRQETPDLLSLKLEAGITNLTGKGISPETIRDRCLLTPSCGTGSLPVDLSEEIFNQLAELSHKLRGI